MKRLITKIVVVIASLYFTQLSMAVDRTIYVIGKGIIKVNPVCDLVEPASVYKRLSYVAIPSYTCFNDGSTYYTHIIRGRDGSVEIEINLEDQFDGSWYGSVFEYRPESIAPLQDAYRYDLTLEQVQACRAAFEPPVDCSTPN